jgi:hypothetical protein
MWQAIAFIDFTDAAIRHSRGTRSETLQGKPRTANRGSLAKTTINFQRPPDDTSHPFNIISQLFSSCNSLLRGRGNNFPIRASNSSRNIKNISR